MASPDLIVDTVAGVLAGLVETDPARVHEPGKDLTSSPAVGIAPAYPWAEFRHVARGQLRVTWTVRLVVGRWETGPSLSVALECYRQAAHQLRRIGCDVGPLDPPQVVQLAGVPYLLAAFPASTLNGD